MAFHGPEDQCRPARRAVCQILDRLSGIGAIAIAIDAEHYEAAEQLGREFSDDLRLLLDDLGLGESDGEPVALTSSPALLRRALPRMSELAKASVRAELQQEGN